MTKGLITGTDNKPRCWWCGDDKDYIRYHDEEWGRPAHNDIHLFEKICLESFQSGLSWITILRKRNNFRTAFDGFDFHKISCYGDTDIERLLKNKGIVRHRGKIEATINNAHRAIALIAEIGSLAQYFWQFKPDESMRPHVMDYETVKKLTKTPESTAMSKDLKKRGWKFIGPTTCYAFMQSEGIVNDHLEGCHIRGRIN